MCYIVRVNIVCVRMVYVHVKYVFELILFYFYEVMNTSLGLFISDVFEVARLRWRKSGYYYTHCNRKPAFNTFPEMLGSLPHYL
jgi:hypothetical protein